jgi:hypothetical protein
LERILIEQENGKNDEELDSCNGLAIGGNLRELSWQNNDAISYIKNRLF